MTRKNFLISATTAIGFAGFIILMIPFFGSLKPSAKAEAALPRIDISKLNPGQFIFVDPYDYKSAGSINFNHRVFIYKNKSGEVKAWALPLINGYVAMPDIKWWRLMYSCKDFGPHTIDGYADESKPIECHDKNLPSEWWQSEWHWNFNGENLGTMTDDLEPYNGVQIGNDFVLEKRN